MRRIAIGASGLALLLIAGCAYPIVVVDRKAGRVDGARSISTYSDVEWTIERQPDDETDATPRP